MTIEQGCASPQAGWLPIETAPKDASRVLIHTPGSTRKVQEAWWALEYEGGPGYWQTPVGPTGRGYMILPEAAKHWMPLPPAPTVMPQGADGGQARSLIDGTFSGRSEPDGVKAKLARMSAERAAFEREMLDYGWRDFSGNFESTQQCWYYDDDRLQARWFGWHRRAAQGIEQAAPEGEGRHA